MPNPTIVPAPNFNPLIDAEILQSAIGYISGNDDEVICVLCSRCNSQRQQIAQQYEETVCRDLEFELDSTLPGDFKTFMAALCESPDEFLAREVSRAVKAHKGNVIIEVFCTSTNAENAATNEAYRRMFETELQDDLREHTVFRKSPVFELLVSSERDEAPKVDKEKINKTVHDLLSGHSGKPREKYEAFCQMLATWSLPELRSLFDEYECTTKRTLESLIRNDFYGDDDGAALAFAAQAIRDPLGVFAKNLESFYGSSATCFEVSTDQHEVIRTVVSRSEKDLGDILAKYKAVYGIPFMEPPAEDSTNSYEKALYALVTGNVDIPIQNHTMHNMA